MGGSLDLWRPISAPPGRAQTVATENRSRCSSGLFSLVQLKPGRRADARSCAGKNLTGDSAGHNLKTCKPMISCSTW